MALDIDAWISDTNESITIQFDRNGKDVFDESFNPAFTYSIFGEDEKIIGYQELAINLRFRSHDLRPSVQIKHKRKIDAKLLPEEVRDATLIEPKLEPFMPEGTLDDSKDEPEDVTAASWKPPGQLTTSYTQEEETFEIWQSSLADPRTHDILSNMQIFIPFFIEGGTCTFLEDPDWMLERWKVYLVYQVGIEVEAGQSPYCLAGFSTAFRTWAFPNAAVRSSFPTPPPELDQLPFPENYVDAETVDDSVALFASEEYNPIEVAASRERISQFLILPPFQGQAHGMRLYNCMTNQYLKDKFVFEITVEDPNESFDDLRDYCDLARLVVDPTFTALALIDTLKDADLASSATLPETQLISPHDPASIDHIRHTHKLYARQFSRLVEMHLLSSIPPRNRSINRITRKHRASDKGDRQYYFWRLLVKARVWRKNKDSLMHIEEGERVGKLDETVSSVQEEYERILEGFERRREFLVPSSGKKVAGKGKAASLARKRKVIDDEDEDSESSQTSKRRG